MSTTQTPVRIQSLPPIASETDAMEAVRDGIIVAMALVPKPELDAACDAMTARELASGIDEPEAVKGLRLLI
jgi:hypothetical protein